MHGQYEVAVAGGNTLDEIRRCRDFVIIGQTAFTPAINWP